VNTFSQFVMKFFAFVVITAVVAADPESWDLSFDDLEIKSRVPSLYEEYDLLNVDFGASHEILGGEVIRDESKAKANASKRRRVHTRKAQEWYATKAQALEMKSHKLVGSDAPDTRTENCKRKLNVLNEGELNQKTGKSSIKFSF
jgi:hypothetical protein